MTYPECLLHLQRLERAGMRFGFERLRRALPWLAEPWLGETGWPRYIHVAGTNGKGSVARMIGAMLTAGGVRAGLFTSPVATTLCDTITIDGQAIGEDELAALVTRFADADLSAFETLTAVALTCFRNVDIAVLECGMGGRDDATNIIPPPLAAVLTPIALDHAAQLGGTLASIAAHKCGIIKPPCRVVTTPKQEPEVLEIIMETAAARRLPVEMPGEEAVDVPLLGDFQADNARLAMQAVRPYVTEVAMAAGLRGVTMPCRQELLGDVLLDGGHNPHAVAALARTVERLYPERRAALLLGMFADKDVAACAAMLTPLFHTVYCVTAPHERALPAEQLAALCGGTVREIDDVPAERPLVVAGSFSLCAYIRTYIHNCTGPVKTDNRQKPPVVG
ncbi:MAG: Mur ligase family protein [Oscillospiraceae bacterium]|nr:Mur ligase family protein [Oscillospiraceae bacterium]